LKSYKILALIGSILGLIITIGALGIVGVLTIGFRLNTDYQFVGLVISAIIVYIIALCVAFGIKNSKASGIVLIISAVLVLLFSSFYGILGFALLLAAGIVALREKKTPLGSVPQINP
jgi:hypothetical protein